jgi:chromosome segregation ATPase
MIWFPRYDEKTGKNLLEGVRDLRLSISGSISQATTRAGTLLFVWDITGDDPSVLNKGTAAARLELDRLVKRLEKLNADRSGLQKQLDALDKELSTIDARMDELQRQ